MVHSFHILNRPHPKNQTGINGFDHHKSRPVDQICKITNKILKTHGSIQLAAKEMGVTPRAIFSAVNKVNRMKSCRGYFWEYSNTLNIYKEIENL